MTTLETMKARIAREIHRGDLTTEIAEAITTAISAYDDERFPFSESRDTTFSTVAGQISYGSSDAAALARLVDVDFLTLTLSGAVYFLERKRPADIEFLTADGTFTGVPIEYAVFNQSLRLAPIPSGAYTIRVTGQFRPQAPASDAETGNFWMIDGERLIRSRAKVELALHNLQDAEEAATMNQAAAEAERQLMARWRKIATTGRVKGWGLP